MPATGITRNIANDTGTSRGTVNLANGYTLREKGNDFSHKTYINFGSRTLTLAANDTNGASGTLSLYQFATGVIKIGGGAGSLTLTTASSNVAATGAAVISMGTIVAGSDNSTLLGQEANIINSNAFTLVNSTKSSSIVSSAASISFVDGSTTAANAFLNVAFPAAGATGGSSTSVVVTGFVSFVWDQVGEVTP